jgi:hypothetical protein
MSVMTAGAPPRPSLRYQLDTSLARMNPAERAERGKAARAAVPIESLVPRGVRIYGEPCGWTLARAHARSPGTCFPSWT